MTNDKYVIGIDIGGTKLSLAKVNLSGQIMDIQICPTPQGEASQTLSQTLSLIEDKVQRLIDQAEAQGEPCLGLGVAAPGPTDRQQGILRWCPSAGWRDVPLRERFEDRFGLPVQVANDVQAAAVGELHFGHGAAQQVDNFFWMTVSTGIGGSFVLKRKLYEGKGMAGEVGHLILDENGPIGSCGHRGCLESLASGPAIAKRIKALSQESTTPAQLVNLARQGNSFAQQIWAEAGATIGKALSYIINLLDPDLIILGGGVILGAGEIIIQPIITAARHHALDRPTFPRIIQTKHGREAGVIGAAALMLQEKN